MIDSSSGAPSALLPAGSGWLAVALFVAAATLPIVHRVVYGRRAAVDARPMRMHVVIGLATASVALVHALFVLPSLGGAAVITGGTRALAPGAIAFFMLVAHVGVGLRLREPRLRERARVRRRHALIATGIAVAIVVHVVALRMAS